MLQSLRSCQSLIVSKVYLMSKCSKHKITQTRDSGKIGRYMATEQQKLSKTLSSVPRRIRGGET